MFPRRPFPIWLYSLCAPLWVKGAIDFVSIWLLEWISVWLFILLISPFKREEFLALLVFPRFTASVCVIDLFWSLWDSLSWMSLGFILRGSRCSLVLFLELQNVSTLSFSTMFSFWVAGVGENLILFSCWTDLNWFLFSSMDYFSLENRRLLNPLDLSPSFWRVLSRATWFSTTFICRVMEDVAVFFKPRYPNLLLIDCLRPTNTLPLMICAFIFLGIITETNCVSSSSFRMGGKVILTSF